jgi:alpha-D-ribose 1-methylphosphonate 5-triphosphate synthase subunit PhnH
MLAPGFADPTLAAQSVFRCVMDAMARPGRVCALAERVAPPPPLSAGAAAIALTLLDQDAPVWLDPPLARSDAAYWLRFHAGAPIVADPRRAAFAILSDPAKAPAFDVFALGSFDDPDRAATLILQVESLEDGPPLALRGPGVNGGSILRARPLPGDMRRRLAANRALFPRGVDLVLATNTAVAALPRSVTVIDEA